MALSATVVAATPGPVQASDADGRGAGWAAAAVRFEPVGPASRSEDRSGAGALTVTGTGTYRGSVEVRRNGRSLAVVNHVGFEEYVRGIKEVPPSWPAAALEAQAIAARTYAAHKVHSRDAAWRAVGADICATPRCQVYRGLDAEREAQGYGWLAAVEATAGRVLLADGRPIMASYSATADGPLAMSQNGALDMAREGRSAGDILSAYYGGIRPTKAPGGLPATIRVALATGVAGVRISAAGPFRVVDGDGAELARSTAGGEWSVVADADHLRVVPPETHQDVSPVEPVSSTDLAVGVRRPARVLTASAPPPGPPAAAAAAAMALAVVASAVTITIRRRRRA